MDLRVGRAPNEGSGGEREREMEGEKEGGKEGGKYRVIVLS